MWCDFLVLLKHLYYQNTNSEKLKHVSLEKTGVLHKPRNRKVRSKGHLFSSFLLLSYFHIKVADLWALLDCTQIIFKIKVCQWIIYFWIDSDVMLPSNPKQHFYIFLVALSK